MTKTLQPYLGVLRFKSFDSSDYYGVYVVVSYFQIVSVLLRTIPFVPSEGSSKLLVNSLVPLF